MTNETFSLKLDFQNDDAAKTLIDKREGLKLNFGLIRALPAAYGQYEQKNNGFCMALQCQGMAQDDLDRACHLLAEAADASGIDLLLSRSDLPYDSRWFIAGDIGTLLQQAKLGKINTPFAQTLYDEIITTLDKARE